MGVDILARAMASGKGGGASDLAIKVDSATDEISLTKSGEPIPDSGATLPKYSLEYDTATGGLTLTKDGQGVQGGTVALTPYGSPLKAAVAADMTDTDKVYVYTGSESGYENGHWYYYDSDATPPAWTDGGVYNAVSVVTDKTLTVEDVPADAKATGEAIDDLKTQLDVELSSVIDYLYIGDYLYKKDTIKSDSGTEGTAVGTDLYKIPISSGEIIKIGTSDGSAFWGSNSSNYVLGIELSDESYVNIKESPRSAYGIIDTLTTNSYVMVFGQNNISYVWVSIVRTNLPKIVANKNYAFNKPSSQFFKITDLPLKIDDKVAIKSRANISGSRISTISSPFYTLSMPIKSGDILKFNGRVGTSSSNALFRSLVWEFTNIDYQTLTWTAPSDGYISIMASSDVDTPNATYYPYNSKMEQVVTAEELEAAFDEELAPYPLTETVVQKRGNGKLNPGNIITNPSLDGLTNWTITDSGSGTWEVLNGDAYSKILHINTATTNVKIVPTVDTSAEISSFLLAFKMYGVKGTGAGVQLVATGKDASNNTITVANGIYSNVWDRTDANWKEVKIYVPLSTPLHNIAISFYTRANNYDFKFKDFYIGENTWGFPYVVDNGLDYNGISDNALKLTEREKTIVCFGDSITDNGFLDGTDIATEVKYKTGADTVINFGFGGCQMSQHHTNYYDPFSMYRLAYAIANNDWALQDGVMELSPIPSNAQRKIDAMKAFDFSKVTDITIEYGTNDWANGQVIENENDLLDTDTIAGALRYSIQTLLTAFPHLHISIVSTAWRCVASGGVITTDSDTNTNSQGNTLPEINAKLKQIADEYHLQFIDMYNNTGFNRFTFLANYNDNIHPGSAGRKTMGDIIARHIS